jgi:hypothetical protein
LISFSYGQRMHLSHSGRHFGRRSAKGTMVVEFGAHDWRERKVREWLLLLLRFAVTREATDQVAALALADQLDSLGIGWNRAKPGFFVKTNIKVCNAILALRDGEKDTILRTHLARIDDPRLKKAFRAAVGLHDAPETRAGNGEDKWQKHPELWKGLSAR